jgi:SET domain-containing protein
MILVLTRIKPSPIHGLGLFAAEFIRKETVVVRLPLDFSGSQPN